jgi:hypothetical protein
MCFNFRGGSGSGSAPRAKVEGMRDMVGRTLGTVSILLVMAFVDSGPGAAFEAGTQDAVTSSATQLPSGQTVTALATGAVRTGDCGAPGPQVKVKWEAEKLSLDVDGAPLSEVLQAVSRETGIEVVGARRVSNRVCTHLAGMGLVQALKELLSGVDYAVAAGASGSASAQTTRVVIVGTMASSRGATSPVKAETRAPDTDRRESRPAAIEGVAGEAPDGAEQESQSGMAEAAATTAPDAAEQEDRLAAIEAAAASGDVEAIRNGLQDVDPAVQAMAFQLLAEEAPATAVDDLLAGIQDASQPTRLQSLQLLVQSPMADDQTVMAVLGDALKDPDPAFVAFAVQTLAGLSTEDAMDALSDAFQDADSSTKLMIIDSVANTEAGRPLLGAALSDPDATVSSAAATVLKRFGSGG